MIVKKFQAATETEAILKAQAELGSQAVVLNVKTLKQRGIFRLFKKDVVEVTAALEESDFVDGINKKKPTFENRKMPKGIQNVTTDVHTDDSLDESSDKTSYISSSRSSGNNLTKNDSKHKIDLVAGDDTNTSTDTKAIEQKLNSLQNILTGQMNNQKQAEARTSGKFGMTTGYNTGSQAGKSRTADSINSHNKSMKQFKDIIYDDETFDSTLTQDETDEGDESRKKLKERENANFKFLQLIYRKMLDNEVDEKYADEIIGDIESSLKKESNIDSILAAVYQKVILKLGEPKTIEIGDKPKVIIFIGPTGVGKTTTIAKIAARFKLEKYAKVAFITSDTYRIAAVEQLNTYASIIDCPISVVYSAEEMEDSLRTFKDNDLIMVDTAGRSHKSEEQMLELENLIEKVEEMKDDFDFEVYLTLSVTTKYKDLINITEKYKDIKDWALIFTKLDETVSLGNILNIRLLTGAQLSYTTSGQNVPNDIEVINEQGLAKQLLGGNA